MSESQFATDRPQEDRDTVLEVRDATVTYEMGRGQARVLNEIDLDIYRGETLGIVGESGSGKSMFASTLMDAVEEPGVLRGEITYYPEEGEPVDITELEGGDTKRLRWEEIALVSQGAMSAFNPTKPIRTHFEETLSAHNADKDEGMERARSIMRDLNLDPDAILGEYQHELSGGQRQRALVALGLLLEPEVLILDEPTAALDLLMQRSILRLLYEIKEDYDITLIVISHDLPVVSGFVDRLGVMYAFEFVELGETRDVMHEGAHPYTRALLRSTPNLAMEVDDITTIEGSSPDPINIPSGCSYSPRCPVADDRCTIEDPDLIELEDDHDVACFYPDRARKELPVTLSEDDSQ
ncbi:ABC transporter ATP-binding protein [Halosimplex sp. J119]